MPAAATSRPPIWWPRRRRWSRLGLRARCYVRPLDPRDGDPFPAEIDNVGHQGMFVATERPVPVQAQVRIDVLPEGSIPLRVTARVAHTNQTGFGCAFTNVSALSRAALTHWLALASR